MLLPPGTPVQVLMFDGRKAGGQVLSADATAVRVLTASGEAALAMDEVMRVDRPTDGSTPSAGCTNDIFRPTPAFHASHVLILRRAGSRARPR